jgi:hypothetical protein
VAPGIRQHAEVGGALAGPAGAAPPLVTAKPMSGSAAAAPSHSLRRIPVSLTATS